MTTPLLRTLDDIEGADLPLVGHKAYGLAVMKQHDIQVPAGLVLTTTFFKQQLQRLKLIPLWAGSPDVEVTSDTLSWLADTLKTKPLHPELTTPLNQALTATFGPQVDQFAVRSSAIDEDQQDHTFAGIHLTELGVPRALLSVAITRCWASAMGEAATHYRLNHGLSIQGIQIALLIQPMLTPQSSGVGFTLNPLNGLQDELVIEADFGLAEVVGGNRQPYFYRLANTPPQYPILEERAGQPTATTAPLTATDLSELAQTLVQIQSIFGAAQDVEWAKQGSRFFFLQARPIQRSTENLPSGEWTRLNLFQSLPTVPSPLLSSFLERVQHHVDDLMKVINIDSEPHHRYLKTILGRPYINLSLSQKILTQIGLRPSNPDPQHGLFQHLTLDGATVWRQRPLYRAIYKQLQTLGTRLSDYEILANELGAELATVATTSAALHTQLHRQLAVYQQVFQLYAILSATMTVLNALSQQLLSHLTADPEAVSRQLRQQSAASPLRQTNQALLALVQQASADPDWLNHVDEAGLPTLNSPFKTAFEQFLADYGEQGLYPLDMAHPRYADDPAGLLQLIQQATQTTADEPKSTQEQQALRSQSGSKSVSAGSTDVTPETLTMPTINTARFWVSWRWWAARWLLRWHARLLAHSYRLQHSFTQTAGSCRRWFLQLGQRWHKQGWLAEADDIFWLTFDEIERAILLESQAGSTLAVTVQMRQETHQSYQTTYLPQIVHDNDLPALQFGAVSTSTDQVVVGLPISPGQVSGTVLVLQHPDAFEPISEDIILVTAITNSDWLPLFSRVKGLIIEVGGLLSHGSIIAREYHLPAVANIPQATQRFKTGDRVLVDGSTGIIQILEQDKR